MQDGWDYVSRNEDGTVRHKKWQCNACDGRWKASERGSMMMEICMPGSLDHKRKPYRVQIVLDQIPEKLWNQHLKNRKEYYERREPVAELRNARPIGEYFGEATRRLTTTRTQSDLIWNAVLGEQDPAMVTEIHNLIHENLQGELEDVSVI